ncbi:MAG: alpha-glucosidase [Victivallales bacterium]|nr:alpha-glucosidase [Victivallales bacterium]MCF7888520.1 alpha-glucosidase [Victivallales bacterium]
MIRKEEEKWWKELVVYQVYPRSFKDSSGNGIGDLKGITEKLDYIKSLGVNAVWLNPVYESPCDDMGYDISDYRNILRDLGTMDDFKILLNEAHKRNILIIMDLVVNHTSDEHEWFSEACKSRNNPYHDYYFFKDARNGIPNNWVSFFSGSAWDYNEPTDEYYLHIFSKKQPDLNWENEKVRREVYDIMKFWFEMGIDGFRMDVINLISKKPGLPDRDEDEDLAESYSFGPKFHDYMKEMNREVLSKYKCVTVGECPGTTVEQALDTVGYDRNELHMIFHFDAMPLDSGPNGEHFYPGKVDYQKFKQVFTKWHKALYGKGWNSIYLMNHDQPRAVSRFGNDGKYREETAKMLATFQLSMCGTPYIYQGEEIGMTNCHFEPEEFRDIQMINYYAEMTAKGYSKEELLPGLLYKGRDNSRTPMQWDRTKNGGFSNADNTWIKVNPNYEKINVDESENDPDSILNYFRKMIKARKNNKTLVYGDYDIIEPDNEKIYAYKRFTDNDELIVILNLTDGEVTFNSGYNLKSKAEIIGNYSGTKFNKKNEIQLRPYEAKIIRL